MPKKNHQSKKFLEDVERRQRNIAFPDTTQNEARFWRNIGNPTWNATTKIGLGVLAAWVLGIFVVLIAELRNDNYWTEHLAKLVLGFSLVFGPIFGGIAWATHRTLNKIKRSPRRRRDQWDNRVP